MSTTQPASTPNSENRAKILLIGALVGALTGLGAAYLLIQRADEEGITLTPGEGIKLGVTVFSFLRQITQLGG